MTAGPLRRIIGILGLLALAPVAFGLATGTLAVEDAALRAVAVGAAVVFLGRVASVVLSSTVRRVEADLVATEEPGEQLVG
jgi:hypothetical protein